MRLAQDLGESQERATKELHFRERAEKEVSRLRDVNAKLQQRLESRTITADYFNPRLRTILNIVEELKKEMPPN